MQHAARDSALGKSVANANQQSEAHTCRRSVPTPLFKMLAQAYLRLAGCTYYQVPILNTMDSARDQKQELVTLNRFDIEYWHAVVRYGLRSQAISVDANH